MQSRQPILEVSGSSTQQGTPFSLRAKTRKINSYLEEKKRNNGGWFRCYRLREVKRTEQRGRVEECREEREDGKDVELRDDEELGWVVVIPMTKFVRLI